MLLVTKNADKKIIKRKMYSSELHVDGIQFSMETEVTLFLDDTHWQSENVCKYNDNVINYCDYVLEFT